MPCLIHELVLSYVTYHYNYINALQSKCIRAILQTLHLHCFTDWAIYGRQRDTRDKLEYLNFYQVICNFTVCPHYHGSLSHLTQHSAVFGERTLLSEYNVIH
jgi:hypothetical protein